MKTIIATIKEQHLTNIRLGRKLREMRKTCPEEVPFRALCCQSGSGGKILAEFIVDSPMQVYPRDWPELVWFWDVNDMIDYCSTNGYRVRNVSEFGLKRAPQSWCYVEDTP